MVVLSLERYAALTDETELKLDEADRAAAVPLGTRQARFFQGQGSG